MIRNPMNRTRSFKRTKSLKHWNNIKPLCNKLFYKVNEGKQDSYSSSN